MRSVPVVYNDYDTFLHRRDPRVKLLAFAALVLFLYVAPTWHWMIAMFGIGVGLAIVARVNPKWLLALAALQIPNILGFVAFPAIERVLAGRGAFAGDFGFGLKLAFSFPAALFVSASLFTTMRETEITDGLRGLGVPEFVCFTFEYAFLLLYTVFADILRIADGLKLKGVAIETRNPLRMARNLPKLGVPAIITVFRRSTTMMAVLRMRGYPLDDLQESRTPFKFDFGDAALLAFAVGVLAVTAGVNFGLWRVPVLPAS
ncbi:energy-coupling factor transporter transmembrane component T family protein [Halobaculum gomorrense]|uniref:Energy-coupling factor transport system permease protein n=1 Tax=Halobaculum gomorrense TaxID=43928 RepID=A0A1M5MR69_9EURY|nr:energy-coupling factor transporter transmembrane component T [Halobaculum gomorrense]SHG79552.1 energy-coupling factor transport system permease protein [Halobaculum gomorrense]